MNPFKAGDIVECIDPDTMGCLRLGAKYIVRATNDLVVNLDTGDTWGWQRFRLASTNKGEKMKEFKVGDIVRRIGPTLIQIKHGEIYTVKSVRSLGLKQAIMVKEYPTAGHWDSDQFELVDELADLIDLANSGLKAIEEIRSKYNDKIEAIRANGTAKQFNTSTERVISVRMKAEMVRFLLTESRYEIKVKDGQVFIGCQTFDINYLQSALHLLSNNATQASLSISPSDIALATRSGIRYRNYTLSWKDAEQLYNELIKIK